MHILNFLLGEGYRLLSVNQVSEISRVKRLILALLGSSTVGLCSGSNVGISRLLTQLSMLDLSLGLVEPTGLVMFRLRGCQ
jgi:hypothetical protein